MELLFCPGVTVLTAVTGLADRGVAPLVPGFDVGTRRRTVLELLRTPSFVLVVVVLRETNSKSK